jgi:hypothetical protein
VQKACIQWTKGVVNTNPILALQASKKQTQAICIVSKKNSWRDVALTTDQGKKAYDRRPESRREGRETLGSTKQQLKTLEVYDFR